MAPETLERFDWDLLRRRDDMGESSELRSSIVLSGAWNAVWNEELFGMKESFGIREIS